MSDFGVEVLVWAGSLGGVLVAAEDFGIAVVLGILEDCGVALLVELGLAELCDWLVTLGAGEPPGPLTALGAVELFGGLAVFGGFVDALVGLDLLARGAIPLARATSAPSSFSAIFIGPANTRDAVARNNAISHTRRLLSINIMN